MSDDIVDRLPPSVDWDEQLVRRLGNEATSVEGVYPSIGDALRQAAEVITRLRAEVDTERAVLDAIDALPSPLHDDDSQSLVEAVEDCWGNSDDIAYAGWKIGYAAALVDVWRILLPGGQQ